MKNISPKQTEQVPGGVMSPTPTDSPNPTDYPQFPGFDGGCTAPPTK